MAQSNTREAPPPRRDPLAHAVLDETQAEDLLQAKAHTQEGAPVGHQPSRRHSGNGKTPRRHQSVENRERQMEEGKLRRESLRTLQHE